MGQAAVPIMLAVAGAGVSEFNQRKTSRKRDRILAEGIRKQSESQQQANVRINEALDFAEDSGPEKFKDQLHNDFLQKVLQNRQSALSGFNRGGNVSDAFTEKTGLSEELVAQYGELLSGLFSRIDAPGRQRQAERAEFGDLGSAIDVIGRNSRQDEFLNRLKLSRVRDNPWLSLISAALGGASSGTAAKAFSPGAATASTGARTVFNQPPNITDALLGRVPQYGSLPLPGRP